MMAQVPERIFVLLFLLSQVLTEKGLDLNFFQNDYHLKGERGEIVYYNKDYMKIASFVSFKYNRTDFAFNLTVRFNIDVGSNLQVVFQTYKFSSNEYRLFPLRVGDAFCKGLDADIGGIKQVIRKCGNVTQCLFLKDTTYHVCNAIPDESKLPPHIPNGRYMAEAEVSYKSIKMFVIKIYAKVTRPEA